MSLNRMFKSKQTKLFSRAFALSVALLARLVCVLCPFLMPPIDHMSCRGALEYLKFVSSSVMVTLAQLPTVTAWVLWVPSVCSCPAYRGIWQNKECCCGWLSCFCPRKSLWVIHLCLAENAEALPAQSFKCSIWAGPSLSVMEKSWHNSCFQFGAWCHISASVVLVYICFCMFLWTQASANAPWSTSSPVVPPHWHCHLVTAPKSLFLELWFFRPQRNHSTMMWYWALTRLHIYMLRA